MKGLVVNSSPKSLMSEAFKSIRTNLEFLEVDDKIKSLLITSTTASDGKSFTASNLAVAYTQIGKKVLLMDADMRRGRIHEIFDLENENGLSNLLLMDVKKSHKKFIQKTEIENLHVLPAGIVPPNPSELLLSKKNRELMEILKEEYDLVIVDSVPLSITDSIIMADIVDKIVIVASHGKTKKEEVASDIKQLDKFKSKIAGVILNRTPRTKNSYYYGYYTKDND